MGHMIQCPCSDIRAGAGACQPVMGSMPANHGRPCCIVQTWCALTVVHVIGHIQGSAEATNSKGCAGRRVLHVVLRHNGLKQRQGARHQGAARQGSTTCKPFSMGVPWMMVVVPGHGAALTGRAGRTYQLVNTRLVVQQALGELVIQRQVHINHCCQGRTCLQQTCSAKASVLKRAFVHVQLRVRKHIFGLPACTVLSSIKFCSCALGG